MKRLKLSLASILEKWASQLSRENVENEIQKTSSERYKPNPEARDTAPITRTIVNIPQSILDEYRRNQNQENASERANRTIATWAVAGAFLLAVIRIWQACLSRQANRDSQNGLELSERPWVGPSTTATVARPLTHDHAMLAKLCVTNTGHSPGVDMNIAGLMIPGDSPTAFGEFPRWLNNTDCDEESRMEQLIPKGQNVVVLGQSSITIFPNSEFCSSKPSTIPVGDDKSSDARVDKVLAGTNTLYLSGCILYDDTLGKHHWTSFCQFYDVKSNSFGLCPIHNSTDKNQN